MTSTETIWEDTVKAAASRYAHAVADHLKAKNEKYAAEYRLHQAEAELDEAREALLRTSQGRGNPCLEVATCSATCDGRKE